MADPYGPQTQSSTFNTSPPPKTPASASSSSDSSSTATVASNPDPHFRPPHSTLGLQPSTTASANLHPEFILASTEPTTSQSTPSNDAIEAAIRAAINSSSSSGSSHTSPSVGGLGKGTTSDGRSIPPRDTRTQLFVGNLPYRVRWQDLKDLFRRAGTVLRADVSLGADNRSRGYGTVLLATAEDAGRAIDMFNGYEWQTRMLEVRVDRVGGTVTESGAPGMGLSAPQTMSSGMYMGQQQQPPLQSFLSPNQQFPSQPTGQASLFLQSKNVGQQHHIYSPQPQPVSMSQFQSQLQAQSHSQSQFEQLQQQYHTQLAQLPNPPSIPGRTLFVGNLPYHVQWQDLKDLFRRTPGGATVLRADVALGPDGRSKGFGTVTLRTEEETERAKRWFSGYEFNGRQLKVHHDRITLPSTAPGSSQIPFSPPHPSSASPSYLSQKMMMLNLSDTLGEHTHSLGSIHQALRSTSASPSTSSSNQHIYQSQSLRLRGESILSRSPFSNSISISPATHTSSTVQSLSSPLLRQIQAYQQEQAQNMRQPSPLYSDISTSARQVKPSLAASSAAIASSRLSHSKPSSIGSNSDLLSTSESTLALGTSPSSVSMGTTSNPQTSPSVSRANRPTHIALPAPSFHFDFDPSMASLDSSAPHAAGYDKDSINRIPSFDIEAENQAGFTTIQQQRQTTPLQMHFRQYLERENADRENAGQGDLDTSNEYSPAQFEKDNQLYQLLHGSRQLAVQGTSRSPQIQQRSEQPSRTASHTKSLRTSLAVSASSSPVSLFEDFERSYASSHKGGIPIRERLSSGQSSAAASSRSLPLALGSSGGRLSASSSRHSNDHDVSPEKPGGLRPLSTVSTTGSTTSASESGMSTSLSGSSRTGSSAPPGRGAQEYEKDHDGRRSSAGVSQGSSPSAKSRTQDGDKHERNPHHPGVITLPPPPQVVFPLSEPNAPRADHGTSKLTGAKVGKGLFQQYHPFASPDSRHTGDSAEFEYTDSPTVKARYSQQGQYHSGHESANGSQRRGAKEAARNQEVQQWNDAQAYRQQAVQFGQPSMMQLTPHGLPPMTPSMPPFTFVNSQQPPFHSPGVYPPFPIGAGGTSQFQQRQQRGRPPTIRARQHPNAPGTLSLPPQQLVFMPGQHQQSPILSPASTIGPGSAASMQHVPYLHPLGSPGSPYALGPHHPLHHAQQQHHQHYQPTMYGHMPMPHPLSHSFGSAAAAGAASPGAGHVAAMSPGAPWGRPGDMMGMNPFVNPAVGAPVPRGSRRGEGRGSRSRSRSDGGGGGGDQAAQQQCQQPQGGGYWVYGNPHMSLVEPRGYFDQLYMAPSEEMYPGGGGEAEQTGGIGAGEGSRSVIEREILKGKVGGEEESGEAEEGEGTQARPPLLESSSSQSTKSSTMDRESWRSTSVGTPETTATTDDEGDSECLLRAESHSKIGPGSHYPPTLHHASTEPVKQSKRLGDVARRSTVGEEI